MKSVVFISYSTKDADVASRVLRFLEERGCNCWIAPRDIRPGLPYGEAILTGIRSADVLLVIVSSHSTSSPHVRREVEAATSLDKAILPIVIDTTPIPDAILYYLGDHQRIGVTNDLEASLPTLLSAIRGIAGNGVLAARSTADRTVGSVHPENRNAPLKPDLALVVTDSKGTKRAHPLGATRVVIGRSNDADIQVSDDSFSRNQFALNYNAALGTFELVDFGARNGVLVNENSVPRGSVTMLDIFDVIRCGRTTFELLPLREGEALMMQNRAAPNDP